MARPTPYLFCRYLITENETGITSDDEWRMLEEVRGRPIAYRVREPNESDMDTFLMRPRAKIVSSYKVHTWEIAQDVKFRERMRYDRRTDEVAEEMVETDEIRMTKFIAIPRLGVFAVEDALSERSLGAKSAVARFRSILEQLIDDVDVTVNFAGTPQDAQRALDTWKLEQFSFTVRPFNPTVRKLGEKIHELMTSDHVGMLRAVATPIDGEDMRDSHEGIISEAKGLTEAGYGQYGAIGTTPDGLRASLSKPTFSMDKNKNIKAQAQARTLKVYIPKGDSAEEDEHGIVKALLDLYGDK